MLWYVMLCYVCINIYTGVAKFENPSFAEFTVHRTPLISGNNSWWMINFFFLNLTTLYMLPATLSAIRAWGVSLMDALAPIQGFPLCWSCKMCRNLSSNFLLGKWASAKTCAELSRTFADKSEPCTNSAVLALIDWFMRWAFPELVGLYLFLFIVQLLDQVIHFSLLPHSVTECPWPWLCTNSVQERRLSNTYEGFVI